ncbi:MAG: hypothetical protein IJZ89_06400 [Clostridia bacterium]|nr:hypothetical protein [Clostridia bacterium]
MNSGRENNNEKKIFGIFKRKEPKELTPEEIEQEQSSPKNIKFFFKLFKRNFSKLLTLNFFMVFMAIPILIALFVYIQGPTTPSQTNVLAPALFGAELISGSPAISLMQNIFGRTVQLPVHNSPIFFAVAAVLLVLALTWGWQNIGSTYILRSMVRGEPIFMWSDYFYAIKRNLKQGFFMGLLDFAALGVLTFDILYFSGTSANFGEDLMYFCTIGISIIYFFMRFYIYLMLITFDLSIFKLLKNALIFVILGIKRNIVAAVGIILMIAVNLLLAIFLVPSGIIVPLILPAVYLLPFSAFISAYAAYPNIKKYMIDPQMTSAESEE